MRALFLIAMALGFALSNGAADEAHRSMWERSLASLRALPEQSRLEREIALEEIAAGVVRGDWTEDEAAEAKNWLKLVFQSSQVTSPARGPMSTPFNYFVVARPFEQQHFSPAIIFLKSSMGPRLRALINLQSNASTSALTTAAQLVTEQWAAARTLEDLRPAVRLLDETFAEFKGAILAPRGFVPPSSSGPPIYTAMDQFLDAYSLVHPDQPFLFPDPTIDPAGFREMWRIHLALRTTERSQFFTQPMVTHHLDLRRAQFEVAAEAARAALDKAVLADAPAESLADALRHATLFMPLFNAPVAYSPQPHFGPPSRELPAPPDYRVIAKPWLEQHHDRLDDARDRVLRPYDDWLAFRQAEESRDIGKMAIYAQRLGQSSSSFPPELAWHVAERMAAPRSPAPREVQGASAAQKLSQQLAGQALFPREGAPPLDALARQWSALADPGEIGPGAAEGSSATWIHLAGRNDRRRWFALRDRALRELLATPDGTTSTDLSAQVREGIERALEGGDTERSARLLGIDGASALLGPAERAASLQSLQQLAAARAHLEAGRETEARLIFRAVVAGAPALASAQFAARELKRLSNSAPR